MGLETTNPSHIPCLRYCNGEIVKYKKVC